MTAKEKLDQIAFSFHKIMNGVRTKTITEEQNFGHKVIKIVDVKDQFCPCCGKK